MCSRRIKPIAVIGMLVRSSNLFSCTAGAFIYRKSSVDVAGQSYHFTIFLVPNMLCLVCYFRAIVTTHTGVPVVIIVFRPRFAKRMGVRNVFDRLFLSLTANCTGICFNTVLVLGCRSCYFAIVPSMFRLAVDFGGVGASSGVPVVRFVL